MNYENFRKNNFSKANPSKRISIYSKNIRFTTENFFQLKNKPCLNNNNFDLKDSILIDKNSFVSGNLNILSPNSKIIIKYGKKLIVQGDILTTNIRNKLSIDTYSIDSNFHIEYRNKFYFKIINNFFLQKIGFY